MKLGPGAMRLDQWALVAAHVVFVEVVLIQAKVLGPHAVDICRVRQQVADGAPPDVRVIALPGNRRAVAFGDARDTETEVQCAAPLDSSFGQGAVLPQGCSAWPTDQQPVGDASQCPACPCLQDKEQDLFPSDGMFFREGVGPACNIATEDSPVDVLLFGLGGGALHTHTLQHCPTGTRVESVEVDPRLATIAEKFFGVPVKEGVSVIDVEDASSAAFSLAQQLASEPDAPVTDASALQFNLRSRATRYGMLTESNFVASRAKRHGLGHKRWEIIAVDCFVDKGVTPESCRSREFIAYLALLIQRGGTLMQHMWHTSPYEASVADDFADTVQLYQAAFGESHVAVRQVPRDDSRLAWDSIIFVKP